MKRFEVYVNVNGDEYLDVIKINCEHFEVVDERMVIADGVVITFKEDMYAVTYQGMDVWKNNNK